MGEIRLLRELRDTQKEGIKFLLENKKVGIRHGTGKGKTYLSLAAGAVLLKRDLVDVVICFVTKNGLIAYRDDLKLTTLNACFLNSVEDYKPWCDIYIIQYHLMPKVKEVIPFSRGRVFGIFDEIQTIKSPNTYLRNQFLEIRGEFDWFMGLTATPVGKIFDIYNITDYFRPGIWGTLWEFKSRYCELRERRVVQNGRRRKYFEIVGYKNLDLLASAVNQVWHSSVSGMPVNFHLTDSPEVTLTEDEEKVYLEAAWGILNAEKGVKIPLNRLHDLQGVVDDSESKKGMAISLVRDLIREDKGVIVYFSRKTAMKEIAERAEVEYRIIDGSVSVDKRNKIKEWFGPRKVIYMTYAGSRSLNLELGNQIVFYECPWEVEIFIQTVGRCARQFVSKYEFVDVWMPIVRNTIDEYRRRYVELTGDLVRKILADGEGNLPSSATDLRRSLFIEMRKNLLWRLKGKRK